MVVLGAGHSHARGLERRGGASGEGGAHETKQEKVPLLQGWGVRGRRRRVERSRYRPAFCVSPAAKVLLHAHPRNGWGRPLRHADQPGIADIRSTTPLNTIQLRVERM